MFCRKLELIFQIFCLILILLISPTVIILSLSLSHAQYPRSWFINGSLPSFGGNSAASKDHSKAVLKSHRLADALYKIKKMVHCTKIKLQAIK